MFGVDAEAAACRRVAAYFFQLLLYVFNSPVENFNASGGDPANGRRDSDRGLYPDPSPELTGGQ
jgi:hypothetical protein